ncbi:MAG: chlorophyll synthesis pathway protein BchC [Rhizobiaceae bacterium]|nr:chlorophyll synthesis pathway protein BchC [Rhizobiaceae bacterium]
MSAIAVVFDRPKELALKPLQMRPREDGSCIVDVLYSGISTGTERLLWDGRMPEFPGMGYPLVPGYESVGRIAKGGAAGRFREGDLVFVPGAKSFVDVRNLFGATASRLDVDSRRLVKVPDHLGEHATLISLAATAYHAVYVAGGNVDLVIGHGVLGRLIARILLAMGLGAPVVWEANPLRRSGGDGYAVIAPEADDRREYRSIIDASGDPGILDKAIGRLGRSGVVTLAGFYSEPLSFAFAPAFMREATIRVAAEFTSANIDAILTMVDAGDLSLAGLISHTAPAADCAAAYETAFRDAACTKMVLDWRNAA